MMPPVKPERLAGFDVARALAILGMIGVHFMLVMSDGMSAESWSDGLLVALDGRPAATFVILAGIGVTLMGGRGGGPDPVAESRRLDRSLYRRGGFLLGCGFLNLTYWEGDILRVYGVSLLLMPWLRRRSARVLGWVGAGFVLAFPALMVCWNYDRNWDWATMTYHHLWTPSGLVRNLFYDGFRSVFPWTGLLIFGVWLGRLDWAVPTVARRVAGWGLGLAAGSWLVSAGLLAIFHTNPQPGLDSTTAKALFGLQSLPPLPLYLLHDVGCALLVIGAAVLAVRHWPRAWPLTALAATGRMAFTWYLAHLILGLGGVILLGWLRTSHFRALLTAFGFFGMAVSVSVAWRKRFSHGPMEYVLRRIG